LSASLRDILGLRRTWNVIIIGAGKIGTALAQYRGFRQRGFIVSAVYDRDPRKIGTPWDGLIVRDIATLERDLASEQPEIAVLAVPAEDAQGVTDRLVRSGVKAILSFAPTQIQTPSDVTVRSVNMAMELEGLSFALTSRDQRNGNDPD
jgi:redox-sensing transcriptional repressor